MFVTQWGHRAGLQQLANIAAVAAAKWLNILGSILPNIEAAKQLVTYIRVPAKKIQYLLHYITSFKTGNIKRSLLCCSIELTRAWIAWPGKMEQ